MTVRTEQQKKDMIEKLEELKKQLPEFSHFGDNNHEGISAQITAIEEEWDEDDAYDNYPDDEDDAYVRDMVIDAINWLSGDQQDDVLLTL